MNLEQVNDRVNLTLKIASAVEHDSFVEYDEGHRRHLGVSIIGKDCQRYIWNSFRWLKLERFTGRKLRLFKRGHGEEPKIIHRLERIGCRVEPLDPATGEQWRVSNVHGHYGGSCDGKLWLPPEWGFNEPLVVEFKTHAEKYFTELAGKIVRRTPEIERTNPKGVIVAQPDHFAQMSSYGAGLGIRYGLYAAVNKNTDELWFEVVKLDMTLANVKLALANEVIFSQTPLKKISESAAFWKCKTCHFSGICHNGEQPEKNCRSCDNAFPAENKRWYCRKHDGLIPDEVIPQGCDQWRRIC